MFVSLRRLTAAALAAALLAAPATAWSAVSFEGSFAVSGSAFSDPGLVVETDRRSGALGFELDPGQNYATPLFRIWTDEASVNADDTTPQSVRVRFDFTGTTAGGGEIAGESVGARAFRGLLQYGRIVWTNPLVLTFGANQLTVSLTDAVFNTGAFGLSGGQRSGAVVGANFALAGPGGASPTPVPLPAPAALLVVALGGLAALSLRRRRRAA